MARSAQRSKAQRSTTQRSKAQQSKGSSPKRAPRLTPRAISSRATALIEALSQGLYEREQVMRLSFTAMIAGESVFLLGPPGTAKSLIARRLSAAFKTDEGGPLKSFQYLMGRFSTPEELFGPISVQGLKRDEFCRKTEGYLPSAHVAFLDELWKASPAILNTLLTALNERVFRNGVQEEPMPLRALIAASNELPREGDGLGALWDRFMLRLWVDNIDDEGAFLSMLQGEGDVYRDPLETRPELKLSLSELSAWQERARAVPFSQTALELLLSLKDRIRSYNESLPEQEPKLYVSDRRWRKVSGFLKAAALLSGHAEVGLSECALLPLCLWDQPHQLEPLFERCAQATFESFCTRPQLREELRAAIDEFKRDLKGWQHVKRLGQALPAELNEQAGSLKRLIKERRAALQAGRDERRQRLKESGLNPTQPLFKAAERGLLFRERLDEQLAQCFRHLSLLQRRGLSVMSDADAFGWLVSCSADERQLPAGLKRSFELAPRYVQPFDELCSRSFGARWLKLREEGLSFKMVYCPPGRFRMGQGTGSRPGYGADSYIYADHEVELTRGFWICETPVTQALYLAVMGEHKPSQWGQHIPIDQTSWFDAAAFCHRLSSLFGLSSGYSASEGSTLDQIDPLAQGFRLPTEAEWVYAAQAGDRKYFAGSSSADGVAWAGGGERKRIQAVGRLMPNAWGLYDMTGNVYELCLDRIDGADFELKRSGPLSDPLASDKRYDHFLIRGGSVSSGPGTSLVHVGDSVEWGEELSEVGFRFVLPA